MQRMVGLHNRMMTTRWTRAVSHCARPTGMEESDHVKWLAPTGAKSMGHDDNDSFYARVSSMSILVDVGGLKVDMLLSI